MRKGERTVEILELNLKSYGRFENHTIALKPGINVIYGGNETGKTTIHSFIRAMFFGLGRSRGKAAKKDEYQIRQPWNAPGAFLGSMRILEDGEVYRIDRCFDRSAQPLQVVCETRAEESAQPEQDLQALLGGISEQSFINTVFIPQAHAETDETFAEELRRFMVNSESTMDGQLDVTKALTGLRKKKRQLEQKKKKDDELIEGQIEKKQERAELVRTELERLRQQADRLEMQSRYGSHQQMQREADQEENVSNRSKRLLELLLFVAGVLCLAGVLLWQDAKLRVFLSVLGALFLGLIFVVHTLFERRMEEAEPETWMTEQEEQQLRYLTEEIRVREDEYQKLQSELEELYGSHVRPDGADTEAAAVTLAIDRICELASGIYQESGGFLNERASRILREITNGRYDRIVLDEGGEVRIHTRARVLGLHQISGGTMQQIYFALRMAAAEMLGEGRLLPVILDETFALYDDARLEAALRWLRASGRQVILFTCQKREREILERI